jgi:hypothetical protein
MARRFVNRFFPDFEVLPPEAPAAAAPAATRNDDPVG